MSRRTIVALLLVLAAGAGAGSSGVLEGPDSDGDDEPAPVGSRDGTVARVVDGDTIHVLIGERREKVRYIGVDTPETKHPTKGVQCYGKAASEFNERLVGSERVRLVPDVEERDRYGRLLAYVYRVRDGLFVNAELVRLGYAQPLSIPPNVDYAERFIALARQAREGGRGLWSAC